MLIYVIPSGYPNKFNPNIYVYVHEQCKALVALGHKVIVLDAYCFSYKDWNKSSCRKVEKSNSDGVIIYANNFRGLAVGRFPRLAQFSYMRKLKKILKIAMNEHGKPDIFCAHFTFISGYSTYLLSKQTNIPFVVIEHYSMFLQETLNNHIKRMLYLTVEGSKAFICVSKTLKNAIQKWTNTKKEIHVIPNMVDNIFKYYQRPNNNVFKFFGAGNLIESKGFDILIQAFCKAFTSHEKVILTIAGEGRERNKLERMIIDNNRQNQIKLLGRVSRDEILKQNIECSCFVLPSKVETFGVVYREAMAVGRPVISAKNGGIEEAWEDSFGKLVEIDDVNGLADAMRYIYENIELYDGEYISKSCFSMYSMDKISRRLNEVFYSILK